MVVADLTHERPNCYLEVGYVLGVGKLTNLILTARADHDPESPRIGREGRECTSIWPASTSCSGGSNGSPTSGASSRSGSSDGRGCSHE